MDYNKIPHYKGYEIHILLDGYKTVSITIIHTKTVRAIARENNVDTRKINPIDRGYEMIEEILKESQ